DLGTAPDHDTGHVAPEDLREVLLFDWRVVASADLVVHGIHARRPDLDEHFVAPGHRALDLLQLQRLRTAEGLNANRLHLGHGAYPPSVTEGRSKLGARRPAH